MAQGASHIRGQPLGARSCLSVSGHSYQTLWSASLVRYPTTLLRFAFPLSTLHLDSRTELSTDALSMALFNPARPIPSVKKGPWSEMEDKRLLDLVTCYGAESWMDISKEHGSRNAKQCRERYHQNLKSSINRDPITPEEGVAIERYHAEKGPKWAEIARALGGRSDNQVKNWYNGQKNRRTKMSAHTCPSVLRGVSTQQSLSAVRPVDIRLLQQRGHTNPYPQRSIDHQSKPSPTTSQISEAPSLISDASSTSSGIPPSPNTACQAQPNLASSILSSWNENSSRPVLPPLCTTIVPPNLGNHSRMSIKIPPILPPQRHAESETSRHPDQPCLQRNHCSQGPRQITECSHESQPSARRCVVSPQAHSSRPSLKSPDKFLLAPREHSVARVQPTSTEPTVLYSMFDQSVLRNGPRTTRQSQHSQLRTASSRRMCTPCRYTPYPSPRPVPAIPDGGERSAQDRMKLVNILER